MCEHAHDERRSTFEVFELEVEWVRAILKEDVLTGHDGGKRKRSERAAEKLATPACTFPTACYYFGVYTCA